MTLRLGLPSKGRLMEDAFAWFAARGIPLSRDGGERTYAARAGWEGLEPVLLSAGEIPRDLASGRLHLGVTGSDLVRERVAGWERRLEALAPMGFGAADVVIAVPDFWVDVRTLDDLDAACAAFRQAHGRRLRIATKYHRLVRDFLRAHGVADYLLVDSQGATEGTVKAEAAEAVADITSTGETLRANGLRVLDDGVIHRSEATLFRSRTAGWGRAERAALDRLLERVGGQTIPAAGG
ncbi:ATP phosphoribosyltransferase [Rubellimicrobium sp. CFH 75288]|uniref:ATP phosphoribosyltransferase n=1 Tax=Rubellimicrobium sp. CFH 75288 TaxID=2697034 RepID=UPI001412AB34|nr:ATP phosphoribosyltransferase [Rubellimicrobium sp. CFH 75288]NAZ37056.1 ATP phosphoribosyltransferase [Rubellimicrobium sp. CFH 75288]